MRRLSFTSTPSVFPTTHPPTSTYIYPFLYHHNSPDCSLYTFLFNHTSQPYSFHRHVYNCCTFIEYVSPHPTVSALLLPRNAKMFSSQLTNSVLACNLSQPCSDPTTPHLYILYLIRHLPAFFPYHYPTTTPLPSPTKLLTLIFFPLLSNYISISFVFVFSFWHTSLTYPDNLCHTQITCASGEFIYLMLLMYKY